MSQNIIQAATQCCRAWVLLSLCGVAGLQATPVFAQSYVPNYQAPLTGCILGGVWRDVTRPTCSESWAAWYGGTWTCTPDRITSAQPITCTGTGFYPDGKSTWTNTFTQTSYPFYECIYGGVGGPSNAPIRCDIDPIVISKPKNLGDCRSGNKDAQLVGRSINPATGNKHLAQTDYKSPPLEVTRYYNSQSPKAVVSSGMQWRHSYSRRVQVTPTLTTPIAAVERANGRVVLFSQNAFGAWVADGNSSEQLLSLAGGGFQLQPGDNSTETFDAEGRLISITDRSGRTVTLNYDVTGQLAAVVDDIGRQLIYGYDGNKRISRVTLPDGSLLQFGYDADGNLTSATYPDGSKKQYHYNEPDRIGIATPTNKLTGITSENGTRAESFTYDVQGRAVATELAGAVEKYAVSYQPGGTIVTDPLLTPSVQQFQVSFGVAKKTAQSQAAGAGCGASSAASTYDSFGNVLARVELSGAKSCYAYDTARTLEIARVEGLSSVAACPIDVNGYVPVANSSEKKTLTQWHPTLRLPISITEGHRHSQYVYDARGNQISRAVEDLNSGAIRTWKTSYTYDVKGFVTKKVEDGPLAGTADSTVTEYYASTDSCVGGHLGCRGQIKSQRTPLGHVTQYSRYNAHGQLEEMIDANGLITTQVYDTRQRLVSSARGGASVSMTYDLAGRMTRASYTNGRSATLTYDDADRLSRLTDAAGNQIQYAFDTASHVIREDVLTVASLMSRTRRWEFDALGRAARGVGLTH